MKTILKIVATALFLSELSVMAPRAHSQGGVPVWTNRYNGPRNGQDEATAMVVDSSGNVLVLGSSAGSGSSYDYATIKYSNAGVPLWTNRYNGPASFWDFAAALATDRSGNVYVTGRSATINYPPFLLDWATVAYSSEGVPLWTNRYNRPGNGHDYAEAVAVDGSGNVFVTGTSDSGGYNDDYVTIKYSPSGVALWTKRYDGPGSGADGVRALTVDSSGNVLVTGYSEPVPLMGGLADWVTIKYSNAGVPLWTNRYNGPGNGYDEAKAIAVDGSDNVFVTGASRSGISVTTTDYATVAYSSAGVPLWTNRYNGPGNDYDEVTAIAVDGKGHVTGIVTGSAGDSDNVTIAYSSAGLALWTNRHDAGGLLAVDPNGNVFVAGNVTLAYSGAGVPLWTNVNPAGASALAVDRSGNLFVTGVFNDDYVTIKYSRIVRPVELHFQRLNNRLVLSWTDAAFSLQSAPAITGTFTNTPTATSPYTNPVTASQQYFRLRAD